MILADALDRLLIEAGFTIRNVGENIYMCEAGNTVLTWTVEGAEAVAVDMAILFKPKNMGEIAQHVHRSKWH